MILITEEHASAATIPAAWSLSGRRWPVCRIAEGLPIKGYLHWSLSTTFEWQRLSMTFGLIAVDRANGQTRHPKPSLASGQLRRR